MPCTVQLKVIFVDVGGVGHRLTQWYLEPERHSYQPDYGGPYDHKGIVISCSHFSPRSRLQSPSLIQFFDWYEPQVLEP